MELKKQTMEQQPVENAKDAMYSDYWSKLCSMVKSDLRTFIGKQPVMELGDENLVPVSFMDMGDLRALRTYLRVFDVDAFTITADLIYRDNYETFDPADYGLNEYDFVLDVGENTRGKYVYLVKMGIAPEQDITFHSLTCIRKCVTELVKAETQVAANRIIVSMEGLLNQRPAYWSAHVCSKGINKLAYFENDLDLLYVTMALKSVLNADQLASINIDELKDTDLEALVGGKFNLQLAKFNGIYMVIRK